MEANCCCGNLSAFHLRFCLFPSGHLITCGNVAYVCLFGWWVSLAYVLVSILMFITIAGVPYGRWASEQRLVVVFIIIDQILSSFILSLTLQANFAGSCPATSCGPSASRSTRYCLGSVDIWDVPPAVSFPFSTNWNEEDAQWTLQFPHSLSLTCGHESRDLAFTKYHKSATLHERFSATRYCKMLVKMEMNTFK